MGDSASPQLPEAPHLGVDVGLAPSYAKPRIIVEEPVWEWGIAFRVVVTIVGCLWTAVLYNCYRQWAWAPMIVVLTAVGQILVVLAIVVFWITIARILWGCITSS